MECPNCHSALPEVTDPTLRTVSCPDCGTDVDLALAMEGTSEIAASDTDPLIGRMLGGERFRIDALLGRGGMGTVYRGVQVSLDRTVAIKVLAPELTADETFIRRFRREAGTLAAIEHPNIVTVHDTGAEDGIHYIVMAHVAGPDGTPLSLSDLMARGSIDVDLAIRIASQVGEGLHHAHERGVVHRDIKPGNILLDARHEAHVADFGIARMAGGATEDSTLTTTGSSMGTLRYMAPEQKVDATRADARSDVYALGAVFYEMLVGTPPEGRFDLPGQVRPGLDPRLDAIVEQALRPDPDRRFATADAMVRELETLRQTGASLTPLATPRATPLPTPPSLPTPTAVPVTPVPPTPTPPGPPSGPTPSFTPIPTVPPSRGPRIPLWIPIVAGVVVLLVVVGLLVGDDDENGSRTRSAGADPAIAAKRGQELREMLARQSPPVHAWFDARWEEIGTAGDPGERARAEASLLALFILLAEGSPMAAVDHEPPPLRGDPDGLLKEYWGASFDGPRLERTVLLGEGLALTQFSYEGKGRHFVLAVCMRDGPVWFCRIYTGTDRPGYDLYPDDAPQSERRGEPDPMASAIGSLTHQMALLRAGRGDELRACLMPDARPYAPDQLIGMARQGFQGVAFADLVQHVAWQTAENAPSARIAMRNGRILTDMVLVDGRWYAASVWFR